MSSYEKIVADLLKAARIQFYREKTFNDLKHGLFRFDFYIPSYKGRETIVEVDGEFHFKPIAGRQKFLQGQEHDRRKNSYCLSNDIDLYRIPYWELTNLKDACQIFTKRYKVRTKWHNDNLQLPQ